MAGQLTDKVAIVTGASSGIGEAIALLFASRGAKVTLCGRDEDRLKSVLDQAVLTSGGHKDRFVTVQGDINQQNVREEIIRKTVEKFGRLDTLVSNVGIQAVTNITNTTEEMYDQVMNTNLKSVFFLIQAALPHLEKSKGCIIGISSIGSKMAMPFGVTYGMSKAGMDHLFRCLALDLGPKGIRINTVNPAFIPTRLSREFGEHEAMFNKILSEQERNIRPLKSGTLTAKDVAELVAFLASDSAGFVTGENIFLDGGRTFMGWQPPKLE